MMRNVFHGFVFVLMMMSLLSCKKTLKPVVESPAHIVIGQSYYTQFVIRYEKGRHVTTNYRRGASVPVNSKVKLVNITNGSIELDVENMSQPLAIKNIQKHTRDNIFQAFDKLFNSKKLNLNQFNSLEKKNIKGGSVAKGMRKKAVTVAIGYPPITETMNLNADTWVYWSHRFNRFKVNFSQGKVSSVVD